MKKRFLSIVCIIAIVFSFSVPFANAEKVILDGIEYDVSELTEEQLIEYEKMKAEQTANLENLSTQKFTNDYLDEMDIEDYYERGWTSELGGDYVKKSNVVAVEKSEYQLAIDLMLYLEIMQKNDDNLFDGEKELSLNDLSIIVSRLNELSDNDVEVGDPGEKITAEYFTEKLLEYLNYDVLGESVDKATTQTKMIKGLGINFSTTITREQAAEILANFMEQGVVKLEYSNGNWQYKFEDVETFLYKLNIGYISGVMKANEITGIDSNTAMGPGRIQIDGNEYKISDQDFNEYLARNVEAYYLFDDDEKTVIAMGISAEKGRYLEIENENIENMTKDALSYTRADSSSIKKVKFSSNVPIIYNKKFNGYLDGIGIEKTVENENPNTVKFILDNVDKIGLVDFDDDNKYDVIIFDYYVNYRILNISQKILGLYGDKKIDTEEYETVKIFKDGQPVEMNKLSVEDVISVMYNNDLIYIYASSEKVEGKLKGVDEGSATVETLEDEETLELDLAFVNDCLVGREYTFYLTYWNKLIFTESLSTDGPTYNGKNYAYMRRVFYDEETETGGIRLYVLGSTSGVWNTYKLAEKVDLYDGASVEDTGKNNVIVPKLRLTPEELANHTFADTPQLIVYHLNDMGDVMRIETAMDISKSKVVTEGVFHRNETLATRLRTYHNGWCGGRYYRPMSTFILNVPLDKSLEDKYYYSTIDNGYMPAGTEVYDADEFGMVEGLFVYNTEKAQEMKSGKVILISDIEFTIDENDELIVNIYDQDGSKYTAKPECEAVQVGAWGLIESQKKHNVALAMDLKVGDLITIETSRTEISRFMFYMRVSDYKNEKFFAVEKGGNMSTGDFIFTGIRYGKVVSNPSEKVLFVNYDENDSKVIIPHFAQERTGSVYLYNTKAKTVTDMSKSEVMVGDIVVIVAGLGYIDAKTFVIR